jgi:hypothetical protein
MSGLVLLRVSSICLEVIRKQFASESTLVLRFQIGAPSLITGICLGVTRKEYRNAIAFRGVKVECARSSDRNCQSKFIEMSGRPKTFRQACKYEIVNTYNERKKQGFPAMIHLIRHPKYSNSYSNR